MLGTRGSWLPGDPRGFRNSEHRIHSSGDYKHPPPEGEHAPLHTYFKQRATPEVVLTPALRAIVGDGMLQSIRRHNDRCLAIAVGKTHTHLLVECVNARDAIKRLTSRLKQASSRATAEQVPGRIWARGATYIPIDEQAHQQAVFRYILNHAPKEHAWVWNFRSSRETD
jgi:REP element-mobilizing transposase RayT